jgi:hypothetical protein
VPPSTSSAPPAPITTVAANAPGWSMRTVVLIVTAELVPGRWPADHDAASNQLPPAPPLKATGCGAGMAPWRKATMSSTSSMPSLFRSAAAR